MTRNEIRQRLEEFLPQFNNEYEPNMKSDSLSWRMFTLHDDMYNESEEDHNCTREEADIMYEIYAKMMQVRDDIYSLMEKF